MDSYHVQVRPANAEEESHWRMLHDPDQSHCGTSQIDAYEPDADWTQAKPIALGESQTLSIAPAGDVDWLVLTLTQTTSIAIETSGEYGDTRLWLFDASLFQVSFDDDGGAGLFSLIRISDLPAGTYYLQVDEYTGSRCIPAYRIEVRQTS